MTQVLTVPAVTAALIAQGTVTVITAAERGIDGRVLIRADVDADPNLPCVYDLKLAKPMIIHPGCIVAAGTVEWVPNTDEDECPFGSHDAHLGAYWMVNPPGRWAGILTDVKATTERCPACWGVGAWRTEVDAYESCGWCAGYGWRGPIPCDEGVTEWP